MNLAEPPATAGAASRPYAGRGTDAPASLTTDQLAALVSAPAWQCL
ncbi:hypothetical protein [Kitasatospora griseola]